MNSKYIDNVQNMHNAPNKTQQLANSIKETMGAVQQNAQQYNQFLQACKGRDCKSMVLGLLQKEGINPNELLGMLK